MGGDDKNWVGTLGGDDKKRVGTLGGDDKIRVGTSTHYPHTKTQIITHTTTHSHTPNRQKHTRATLTSKNLCGPPRIEYDYIGSSIN